MSITGFHARDLPSLTRAVEREIERRIMTGEIPAGARVNEAQLAQSMGVSRGPVREALRGLEQGGLVQLIANRGVIVREIGVEEALGIYDLRSVIFGLAAETVARGPGRELISELRRLIEEGRIAAAAGARDAYYANNIAFHQALVEGSGNRRLQAVYLNLVKELHLFRRRGLALVTNMAASIEEHSEILAALTDGDRSAAFAAGRLHVLKGRARFLSTLEEPGLAEREVAAAPRARSPARCG
jgi:DNA-binding GntR family transcriptional regulator